MAKQIARLLKTDIMADLDLPGLAQLLESKGRKGDTMLAHITPQEAALLKARGGAGTMNPDTGLPEFYKGDFDISQYAGEPDIRTGGFTKTASVPAPEFEMRSLPPSQQFPLSDPDLGQMYSTSQAPSQYSLLPQNAVPNPRTGGYVSPETAQVGGQFGLNFGRPASVSLREPFGQAGEGISLQEAQAAAPSAPFFPGAYTPTPEVQQALTREPGFLDRLKARASSPETLERLGLAGLQTLPAILAAQQATAQGRRAKEEMQRMAAPYQQQGQALVQQAQRGELTAPAQQQIQALQARAAQGVAGRGGVGAEQAAAQTEAFRQQLLQNQYDMGLKVANIGDQIAAGAIRTGLQADQYVNELTSNYFQTLAMSMGGQAPFTQPAQVRRA
jgi:hypothetical protein